MPRFPLEFLNRFETKTLARAVRRKLENGRAVARDDKRLASLDFAGKLGQPIFRFANGYCLHACIVATCSHTVHTAVAAIADRG
jgi:hypothetical protein